MENQKAGTPQALITVAISILPMMAIVALMPVIPAIIRNFKDVPNIMTLAPLIVAAPGFTVALFSPFAGYMTDKLGRRKLLIIFTLLYSLGGTLPFFISTFPSLVSGRLMLGIGEAFILTISNTLLGDYFKESERAKWLMWQSIIGAACGVMLLPFSAYLSTLGWNYPFLVYTFALFITLSSYLFIFEPNVNRDGTKKAEKVVIADKFPMGLMFSIAVMTMVAAILYFVYTLHFSLALNAMGIIDQQQIGYYEGIAAVGVPVGGFFFMFVSKQSSRVQFACLFTLFGIGLVGIGMAINVQTAIAAAWLEQMGAGMAIPILIGWALKNAPPEYRGRGMGFWTSGFFLGQGICPWVVSAMRSVVGSLLGAFLVFGIICLVLAGYNWLSSIKETRNARSIEV